MDYAFAKADTATFFYNLDPTKIVIVYLLQGNYDGYFATN